MANNRSNKKLNIDNLKQELQNIVSDLNNVDNSNTFKSQQTYDFSSNLEEQNRELTSKINDAKDRIYDKLSSLSGKNKFQHLMNKFMEFYDGSQDVPNSFENAINQQLNDTKNYQNAPIKSNEVDNEYIQEIQEIFDNQIEELRRIQKDKANFVDDVIYEMNPNDVTHEQVSVSVSNKLDSIKRDFKLDLNYISSKYAKGTRSREALKFKDNVINLLNDTIEELKHDFKNYVTYNKFLNEKISSINAKSISIVEDDITPFPMMQSISDDKYNSLEDKILKLIDSVDLLANKNSSFENKTSEIIDRKIGDLEEKFNKMINSLAEQNENKFSLEQENSNKIFEKLSNFIDSIKSEKNEYILQTQKQINDIVRSNENEKRTIIDLLQKIQAETISNADAEAYNRSLVNSSKLVQLESLIMRQNDEIEELLKDKNEAFDVIEDILNNPQQINSEELFNQLENNIETIITNFEDKINGLEQSFVDKIESLNSRDMVERNDLIENINNVENRLLQNYETIKLNFADSFNEIINWLNSNRDTGHKLDELLDNVRDIKHGAHQFGLGNDIKNELSSLLESNKSSLIQQYAPLQDKIESLESAVKENKYDLQNKTSELINTRMSELENKFTSLVDVINESNANKLSLEQENSDRLYDKLATLVNSINYDKNEFFLEAKQQISSIIKSNENEKKYIIGLLNKIQEDNQNANDEVALNKSLLNSEKLFQLENLIMRQNQELEELLNDKNQAFDTIQELITNSTKEETVTKSDFNEIENNVANIVQQLENKISNLENTFVSQLNTINSNMQTSLMNSSDNDNKAMNEIINNINTVEQKLIQNYDYIKQNFNESFNEIISKLNMAKDSIFEESGINSKLDTIMSDIDSIKYSTNYGLGDNLKSELREIFNTELNNKLSDLINDGINAEELNKKIEFIETKLNDLTDDIINRNKHDFIELSNKIESVEYMTQIISDKFVNLDNEYDDVEARLFDNFRKYEEVLINTVAKDKANYNELKELIENNFALREQQLSESEFAKLQSLNIKLEKLEALIEMQEKEIENLLHEKDEVLAMISKADPSDLKINSDEIEQLSKVIENKVQECLDRSLNTPNNVANIYKSDNYNELVQVNEKIDELSNYLHENMGFFKNKESISQTFSNDIGQNFVNADNLVEKVDQITNEINSIDCSKEENGSSELSVIQQKLDELKFKLFNLEWDISLLKNRTIATKQIQEIDEKHRHKDVVLASKKKMEIVSDLIDKNKIALNNLYNDRNNLVDQIEKDSNEPYVDQNQGDNEILVDMKTNMIVDKLVNKLKVTFNNEMELLNSKFNNLQSKLIDSHLENPISAEELIDDISQQDLDTLNEIVAKVTILEERLGLAFKILEDKNKELLDKITNLVNENDSYKQIINKFEKHHKELQRELDIQKEGYKDYILNLKNDEIKNYKAKLNKLEKELNKLKELNEKEVNDKLNSLYNQLEILGLQLDSFQEEKNNLYNIMVDKLNYVESLSNPKSAEEFIELETDNLASDKFKDIIGKDTIRLINEKFDTLKDNFIMDLNKIIEEMSNLKQKWSSSSLELQKMNKNNDSTLKLINDNILFFIDELERRKAEIDLFYKKITSLKENAER